jgi:hypothetical protein
MCPIFQHDLLVMDVLIAMLKGMKPFRNPMKAYHSEPSTDEVM